MKAAVAGEPDGVSAKRRWAGPGFSSDLVSNWSDCKALNYSPLLANLYMNRLLKGLKNTNPRGAIPSPALTFHEYANGMSANFKRLPHEYAGERHVVTVGRDPDGKYQMEERPGPTPGDEDQRNPRDGLSK